MLAYYKILLIVLVLVLFLYDDEKKAFNQRKLTVLNLLRRELKIKTIIFFYKLRKNCYSAIYTLLKKV